MKMTEEEHYKAGQIVANMLESVPKLCLNVSLARDCNDVDVQGHIGFSFVVDGNKEVTKQKVLAGLIESLNDAKALVEKNILIVENKK